MRSLGSCEGGALRLSLKGKVGVGEAKRAALGRVGLILQLSGCWGVLPFHEEMAEGVPWCGCDFCQSMSR